MRSLFDSLRTPTDVAALSDSDVAAICRWNDPNGEWARLARPVARPMRASDGDVCVSCGADMAPADPRFDTDPSHGYVGTCRDCSIDDDAPTYAEAREALVDWVAEAGR